MNSNRLDQTVENDEQSAREAFQNRPLRVGCRSAFSKAKKESAEGADDVDIQIKSCKSDPIVVSRLRPKPRLCRRQLDYVTVL